MADEEKKEEGQVPEEGSEQQDAGESGLGNLPPLSDFDSQSGFSSDSGLPPLGSFDSEAGDSGGGLPPISDIDVETPQPTGGNVKPAPPGFSTPPEGTSSGSGLDTPATSSMDTPTSSSEGGFQDLAADSDFSPETPEIGPGPGAGESTMDTPMFDSAFGGGDAGFDQGLDTPAPTQAMETPMFGDSQAPAAAPDSGMGFDQGAFGGESAGGGGFAFDAGTPPPDLSPDTEMQAATPGPGKKDKKKGGGSPLLLVVCLIVGVAVGILGGPYLAGTVPGIPNPSAAEIAKLTDDNARLGRELNQYKTAEQAGGTEISEERRTELLDEIAGLSEELNAKTGQLANVNEELPRQQAALDAVTRDVEAKTEQFLQVQTQYEDLLNETAIVQARQRGLVAEVDRLTGYVGELDDANRRRVATKEALEHSVDRLIVRVKESMPLTPERYSQAQRLANAMDVREVVGQSQWVTPALQEAYTALYLAELEIAQATEYFFANVPVTDRFGNATTKWSECVMLGNWAVQYRSLDGKNIGRYENVGDGSTPNWAFREDLPPRVQKEIEDNIVAMRVPDFESKIQVLAQKELMQQDGTALQRKYDSL